MPSPTWPPDLRARLEKLRSSGTPYRDIAAVLSYEYGRPLTRNAISGLVHRMKLPPLPPKVPAGHRKRRPRRKPPPEQPPPEITVLRVVHTPPPPPRPSFTYSLFDLTQSSCRFPIGEGPFLFCGETKADGRPYCKEHAKRCFHG